MRRWAAIVTIPVLLLAGVGILVTDAGAVGGKEPSPPSITRQPQDASVRFGKSAHFDVKASGTPKPTYQWRVSIDGGPYADTGTSASALHVTATTADDGSLYDVIVSNPSGSVTSQPASLTIEQSPKTTKVKPLIDGLVDKGSQQPYDSSEPFPVTDTGALSGYAAAFSGIVVNETWAQLEPAEGTWDLAPLDQSLAAVSSYNALDPAHPLLVKLRIWGGFTAPQWAKELDGTPIVVGADASGDSGGTLGRFWSTDYDQQWTQFQGELAKQYDSDPLVSEVAVTSCNTATGEPFVMTGTVIAALSAAGWTSTDQQQCLQGALGDYASWHHTAVDFTFNTFGDVSSTGVRSPDMAFTAGVMSACAESETTGSLPECILDNHGLTDTVTAQQSAVYAEIDSLWQQFDHAVPVDFQTDSPNGFDLCEAVGIGIAHHAQSIEVWPPGVGFAGFDEYTPTQLAAWNDALIQGSPPQCG